VVECEQALQHFEESGLDYLPLADHGPHHGHLLFRGPFLGREVVWDCHILPLLDPHRPAGEASRQFIDIPLQKNNNCQHIELGLDVITISNAVVLKCIIMVRQYKNLAYGHHQWK